MRAGKHETSGQAVGQRLAAIEVAADAHVVDARDVADVVDVVGDLGERRVRTRVVGQPLRDAPRFVDVSSIASRWSRRSCDTNPDRNTAITTPPLSGTRARISSGTLRG